MPGTGRAGRTRPAHATGRAPDRVQLDGTDPAQHGRARRHAAVRTEKALGAQCDRAGLVADSDSSAAGCAVPEEQCSPQGWSVAAGADMSARGDDPDLPIAASRRTLARGDTPAARPPPQRESAAAAAVLHTSLRRCRWTGRPGHRPRPADETKNSHQVGPKMSARPPTTKPTMMMLTATQDTAAVERLVVTGPGAGRGGSVHVPRGPAERAVVRLGTEIDARSDLVRHGRASSGDPLAVASHPR